MLYDVLFMMLFVICKMLGVRCRLQMASPVLSLYLRAGVAGAMLFPWPTVTPLEGGVSGQEYWRGRLGASRRELGLRSQKSGVWSVK